MMNDEYVQGKYVFWQCAVLMPCILIEEMGIERKGINCLTSLKREKASWTK
jgi:hypothetical protein